MQHHDEQYPRTPQCPPQNAFAPLVTEGAWYLIDRSSFLVELVRGPRQKSTAMERRGGKGVRDMQRRRLYTKNLPVL